MRKNLGSHELPQEAAAVFFDTAANMSHVLHSRLLYICRKTPGR